MKFIKGLLCGRGSSLMDVAIDSAGVFVGIFAMMLLIIFIEAITNWLKR
jgi:VanZ family protein